MRDTRSPIWISLSSAQRYFMWHYGYSLSDHLYVTEFPKSGGTWLCQLLSASTSLPFIQHSMMPFKKSVFHSHYATINSRPTICLIRDGRDVMVSAYHHFLRPWDSEKPLFAKNWCSMMGVTDLKNIPEHLPRFIEIFYKNLKIGGRNENWTIYHQAILRQKNKHLVICKYEDLLKDTPAAMTCIFSKMDVACSEDILQNAINKYSFENQTKRTIGTEDKSSFLRKGIAGDWKNHFTLNSNRLFDELGGDMLIELGYEKDHQWVES